MDKITLAKNASQIYGQKITPDVIDAVVSAIKNGLANKEDIFLRGFGTFKCVVRREKIGNVISKGERIVIPEHNAVKFKPCPELKNSLN